MLNILDFLIKVELYIHISGLRIQVVPRIYNVTFFSLYRYGRYRSFSRVPRRAHAENFLSAFPDGAILLAGERTWPEITRACTRNRMRDRHARGPPVMGRRLCVCTRGSYIVKDTAPRRKEREERGTFRN